jgi:hypothetical protein
MGTAVRQSNAMYLTCEDVRVVAEADLFEGSLVTIGMNDQARGYGHQEHHQCSRHR